MGFQAVTHSPNAHLSELSSSISNFRLVGDQILTPVRSDLAGAIIKEELNSLFEYIRQLASSKSVVGEIDTNVSEDPYALKSFALRGYCDYLSIMRSQDAGKGALRPLERTTKKTTNAIELLTEVLISNLIFDAANHDAAHTANAGTKFDVGGSDPIKEIATHKDKLLGLESNPNHKVKALFGEAAWTAYRNNDKVRAAFQSSAAGGAQAKQDGDNAGVPAQYAAQQLEVDEVVIGRAKFADESGTLQNIWTDNVLLAVVSEDDEVESGAGGHLLWWGDQLRQVFDWFTHEKKGYAYGAHAIKVVTTILPKILNPKGFFLLTDCVS